MKTTRNNNKAGFTCVCVCAEACAKMAAMLLSPKLWQSDRKKQNRVENG